MNEEDKFIQRILEAPEDDALRLVYADWLEDCGDPCAEFVRVQCALSGLASDAPGRQALQTREKELFAAHARAWCAPLGLNVEQCVFRRGFVEDVEIEADRFLERPEALFDVAPIRRIHFLHATGRLRDLAGCSWLGRLATLDLSGNAVRDEEIATLAASPHLTGLASLDLGGCALHQEGAEYLASAKSLRGLRCLHLAGTEIGPAGLGAILRSDSLRRVTTLDVRGNHQCWVTPNQGTPWVTRTEVNIQDEGVRLLAESPEAARLESVDLSLNEVELGGWDALIYSSHLSGTLFLNLFESDHVYEDEGPPGSAEEGAAYPINEEISDVLCVAIPGVGRRPIARYPGDPRWTTPPCTIDADVIRRLRERFGTRVTFAPPSVRFGALFTGTRADWYGRSAPLDSHAI